MWSLPFTWSFQSGVSFEDILLILLQQENFSWAGLFCDTSKKTSLDVPLSIMMESPSHFGLEAVSVLQKDKEKPSKLFLRFGWRKFGRIWIMLSDIWFAFGVFQKLVFMILCRFFPAHDILWFYDNSIILNIKHLKCINILSIWTTGGNGKGHLPSPPFPCLFPLFSTSSQVPPSHMLQSAFVQFLL